MTIGLGLERPGLWAVRYPLAAALVLLAIVIAALLALPQLRFDDDINRVFLSSSQNSSSSARLRMASMSDGEKACGCSISTARSVGLPPRRVMKSR